MVGPDKYYNFSLYNSTGSTSLNFLQTSLTFGIPLKPNFIATTSVYLFVAITQSCVEEEFSGSGWQPNAWADTHSTVHLSGVKW